jgi:NAD(P)-dependent dehydrogenase (short-subunit alcohol dehydrogenase family)
MTTLSSDAPVVLITGANSGIGAALARRLAADERSLALHGRRDDGPGGEELRHVAETCRELGARECRILFADLGSESAVHHLIDTTFAHFGRIDQIVSNAGYALQQGICQSTWASQERALQVMPLTFAALIRRAAPALRASPVARVVGVSSFVAHRFDVDTPFLETAAAKAAMEAIAKSAAAELAPAGVTVNCVAPGYTRKDGHKPRANALAWDQAAARTPSGRIATPEKIAEAIRFLLSEGASHITGQVVHVDGGLTLA